MPKVFSFAGQAPSQQQNPPPAGGQAPSGGPPPSMSSQPGGATTGVKSLDISAAPNPDGTSQAATPQNQTTLYAGNNMGSRDQITTNTQQQPAAAAGGLQGTPGGTPPGMPTGPNNPMFGSGTGTAGNLADAKAAGTDVRNRSPSAEFQNGMASSNPYMAEINKMFEDMLGKTQDLYNQQNEFMKQDRAIEAGRNANMAGRMGGGLGAGYMAGQRQAQANFQNKMNRQQNAQAQNMNQMRMNMLDTQINQINQEQAWNREDKVYQQRLQDQKNQAMDNFARDAIMSGDWETISLALSTLEAQGYEMPPELQKLMESMGQDTTTAQTSTVQEPEQSLSSKYKDKFARDRLSRDAEYEKTMNNTISAYGYNSMGDFFSKVSQKYPNLDWDKDNMSFHSKMTYIINFVKATPFAAETIFGKSMSQAELNKLLQDSQQANSASFGKD